MRKKGGAVVRAQSTWPENANDREVLGNYALCPRNNDIFAPCKPILRRIKNDCFAVLARIQQNHDNIYENTDLEFACNLTSLVTIFFFFSMDVELQLTPIFS